MNFVIMYRRICYVNIPMDASPMVNVLTTQCRRYYANILMNVSAIMNIVTALCRRHYVNLLMSVFAIMNVFNTQQYWYCDIFSIKVL